MFRFVKVLVIMLIIFDIIEISLSQVTINNILSFTVMFLTWGAVLMYIEEIKRDIGVEI